MSGFTGVLAHGSDPDADMAFVDHGFAEVELKGETGAQLALSDDACAKLIDALRKRWRDIRGNPDDTWKANERALTEVTFRDRKLPGLKLDDGKKRTFMLRPPVALARLHGMYFDTNRCFLLPTATPSLKSLVDLYDLYPDAEILVVAHADRAGEESYNLDLSAERADAMRAYLQNDVDAWLAWYDGDKTGAKRWGHREDVMMIDSLVPENAFGEDSRAIAYQRWHNGVPDAPSASAQARPEGWEELKVDGIIGPKTRRQLVVDYMSLAGTTLPKSARVVTYGCGEHFPLAEAEGEVVQPTATTDGQRVDFDRRVDIFFFRKPFGILPPVPGVADGESNASAITDDKGSQLYPEWRLRSSRNHLIQPSEAAPAVVVEWPDYLSDSLPEGLAIELAGDGVAQAIPWSAGGPVDEYRRFVFDAHPAGTKYSLIAHAGDRRLLLWDGVALDDPENPPTWENLLSDLLPSPTDESPREEPQAPPASDALPFDATHLVESEAPFDNTSDDPSATEESLSGLPSSTAPKWAATIHAVDDLG